MMLSDIFKDLIYGELKHLKLSNYESDEFISEVDPKKWDQLISHINLGLKELYKRFFLSSKEIYVQLYESIEIYHLNSKYAASNLASAEPIKYIEDTAANPFQDDVLKIEMVYDEGGNILHLNDHTEDLSIFTPSYRSIQVPWPNDFNVIAVQYRASHPKIVYSAGMDPATTEIDLPESLHEALLYYIAFRQFASLNTDQGTEGNDYWQKFNASCDQVNLQGFHIQPDGSNWRFDNRGWV
jgi:hypothetical protein